MVSHAVTRKPQAFAVAISVQQRHLASMRQWITTVGSTTGTLHKSHAKQHDPRKEQKSFYFVRPLRTVRDHYQDFLHCAHHISERRSKKSSKSVKMLSEIP